MVKEEKDVLKEHKSAFKTLIKSNGIRFPSDVPYSAFCARLEVFDSFKNLSMRVKVLLHEYY
jgi:regulatory protein YycH of two-component signal transduction system YycFG